MIPYYPIGNLSKWFDRDDSKGCGQDHFYTCLIWILEREKMVRSNVHENIFKIFKVFIGNFFTKILKIFLIGRKLHLKINSKPTIQIITQPHWAYLWRKLSPNFRFFGRILVAMDLFSRWIRFPFWKFELEVFEFKNTNQSWLKYTVVATLILPNWNWKIA